MFYVYTDGNMAVDDAGAQNATAGMQTTTATNTTEEQKGLWCNFTRELAMGFPPFSPRHCLKSVLNQYCSNWELGVRVVCCDS